MSRASDVCFRGIAAGHEAAAALLEKAGDVAVDRRQVPRALVMRCPDGCGDTLAVNLDPRSGKAWRADYREGHLSLYPSVWRGEGCKAHFIVWRDRLIWCDGSDSVRWYDKQVIQAVAEALKQNAADFMHFEEIAARLDLIPWEVLWACQALARRGEAHLRDLSWFRRGGLGDPDARRGF